MSVCVCVGRSRGCCKQVGRVPYLCRKSGSTAAVMAHVGTTVLACSTTYFPAMAGSTHSTACSNLQVASIT